MANLQSPERKRVVISRDLAMRLGLLVWLVAIPLVHGGLPWALSLLGPRYGWAEGRPGLLNLPSLALVAAGFTCLGLVFITANRHKNDMPEQMELGWKPVYLLTAGPYAYSRNPMYLSAGTIWTGWTLFYGSPAILIACTVLCLVVTRFVRREERDLEVAFGESYVEYKRRVPRWLGKVRR